MGEVVRLRLPGEKRWTSGVCTGTQGPRSYWVQVGSTEYRRNRRHLRKGGTPPVAEPQQSEPTELSQAEDAGHHPSPSIEHYPQPEPVQEAEAEPQAPTDQTQGDMPQLRRSTRSRKTPDWITSYVPS